MKKAFVLTIALLLLSAGSSFAVTKAFDNTTPLQASDAAAGEFIVKCSNNVNGFVANSNNQFAATDKHLNGTRNYATSSTDTKIYWKTVATANEGKATLELPLTASDTSQFSAWTAL